MRLEALIKRYAGDAGDETFQDCPEMRDAQAAVHAFRESRLLLGSSSEIERIRPKFSLGQVVATRGAIAELTSEEIVVALGRHAAGDWGDLDQEDLEANERAIKAGARLLSAYQSGSGVKFWIITEADRSATTVLLPEE